MLADIDNITILEKICIVKCSASISVVYGHNSESSIQRDNQRYSNRRFAIPGFWQTPALHGKQVFPSSDVTRALKFFTYRAPFLSALVKSLDGKNQFSMERLHLPKLDQNPGIANLLFQ